MTGAGLGRRLVVEADGGSRGNPGPAGYGALVRDAVTGEVLAEVSEAIGVATNNVAEYQGLIAGLRAAAEIDPSCTVEARMDSRLVVEQMSGRWNIKNDDMRRLATEARRILPPDRVRYTWVPRERNADADRLANAAMDAAASGRRARSSRREPRREPRAEPGGSSEPEAVVAPAAGPLTGGPVLPGRPGSATTLVLARHGRTEHTAARLLSGSGSDPELSTAGIEDARRLAAGVASLGGPSSVVDGLGPVTRAECSPQRRARQTLDIVLDGMPPPAGSSPASEWQPRVEQGWREISFGAWEGLSLAEVSGRRPDQVQAWFAGSEAAPPGGESIRAMRDRVVAQVARTLGAHPGEVILVVAHGGPVATVVHEALGSEVSALWRMRVDPCSLTVVQYWPDGGCQVVAVNVTAHLADARASGQQVGAAARL